MLKSNYTKKDDMRKVAVLVITDWLLLLSYDLF